jgi:beta-glucosidase
MTAERTNSLPSDFVWGASTASYQIEGAVREDGRGESVWDRFSATPGKVRGGDTGEVACDFYHRYRDDLKLLGELGVDAFRFSIGWPRLFPEGRGRVNDAGLDFYDRLVDALLEHEIEPFATLFHWDTPQALEDVGGWPSRATAEAFVEYTETVTRRLGDRVRYWTTHNEPWVHAWIGHAWGEHAPGRTSEADAVAAAHHLLLSHGWAVDAIRRAAPGAQVGISLNLHQAYPHSPTPEDEAAAWQIDGEGNRWFLDPIFRGAYPADLLERNALVEPLVQDGDLDAIATPVDFLGVNNYFRFIVGADPEGPRLVPNHEAQHTEMGWEVYPDGLHSLLVRVNEDYAPPAIYVTENGAAFGDVRVHDGSVHDPERTAYLETYIAAMARAVDDGAPVKGYFVWSLLDNFEWAHGYSKRFGLVYIDYPTLERVPKDSFHWYRRLIASHRDAPRPSPVAG